MRRRARTIPVRNTCGPLCSMANDSQLQRSHRPATSFPADRPPATNSSSAKIDPCFRDPVKSGASVGACPFWGPAPVSRTRRGVKRFIVETVIASSNDLGPCDGFPPEAARTPRSEFRPPQRLSDRVPHAPQAIGGPPYPRAFGRGRKEKKAGCVLSRLTPSPLPRAYGWRRAGVSVHPPPPRTASGRPVWAAPTP
jgi:hypothetical protein